MFSSTVIWVGKLSASDLQKFFKNATPHTLAPWRTALPGAVDPGRRRSLAPTLSPAVKSHPAFFAQCWSNVRRPQPSPSRPLSGGQFRSPSKVFCAPMRCLCRPTETCFSFSACSLPLLFEFSPERSPVLFRRKRRILRIRGLLLAVARGNCFTRLQQGRSRA